MYSSVNGLQLSTIQVSEPYTTGVNVFNKTRKLTCKHKTIIFQNCGSTEFTYLPVLDAASCFSKSIDNREISVLDRRDMRVFAQFKIPRPDKTDFISFYNYPTGNNYYRSL